MNEVRMESWPKLGSGCNNFQRLPTWHHGQGFVQGTTKVPGSGYRGKRGKAIPGSDDSWSRQLTPHRIKKTAILPRNIAGSRLDEGQKGR